MTTQVSISNNVISINLSNTGPQGPSGVGIPTGGTTGQVLAKNSSTNYDTLWESAPVASVFGRSGTVVSASNDYSIGQISGAGTAAGHAATDFLQAANNLSDVASASTSRTSLGLGGLATLSLSSNNAWTGQQYFSQSALTDGSSISWNANTAQAATVMLGGNRTLANPSNIQAGGTYTLIVKQDATGSRTLSYGTVFKWPGGTAPVLSTAASATDILSFISDGTNMYGVAQKAFA